MVIRIITVNAYCLQWRWKRDVTVAPLYAESKVTEIYCIADVICLKFLLRMKIICMTVCSRTVWGVQNEDGAEHVVVCMVL